MKKPVYESMHKVTISHGEHKLDCRLWITEQELGAFSENALDEFDKVMENIPGIESLKQLFEIAEKTIPNLAAMEVLANGNNGCLYYPDWN